MFVGTSIKLFCIYFPCLVFTNLIVNTLGINNNTNEGTKVKPSEFTAKMSEFISDKKSAIKPGDRSAAKSFQENINKLEKLLIETIASSAQIDEVTLEKAQRKLHQIPQYGNLKREITKGHLHLNNFYEDAKNEQKRLLDLDLIEKRRFLRYRIYTAIGIALVVFGLAALSHYTGISLPLSSIKKVSG